MNKQKTRWIVAGLLAAGAVASSAGCGDSFSIGTSEGTGTGGAAGGTGTATSSATTAGSTSSGNMSSTSTGMGVINCDPKEKCPNGFYCSNAACQPDQGHCLPLVVFKDSTREPVCGCDGVTYWNMKVAHGHGQAVRAGGVCAAPTACGEGNKCKGSAHCRIETSNCPPAQGIMGSCWITPSDCGGTSAKHQSCKGDCSRECDLINSETPFQGGFCN